MPEWWGLGCPGGGGEQKLNPSLTLSPTTRLVRYQPKLLYSFRIPRGIATAHFLARPLDLVMLSPPKPLNEIQPNLVRQSLT